MTERDAAAPTATPPPQPAVTGTVETLRVEGARRHNLRDVSVSIPLRTLTVVTGPSGAGKSSLAFDTLHAEGQRRYVESFSTYARQFLERIERPPADRLERIPVAVAIERAGAFRTSRSTVSTMTEIADYTKVLYARLAERRCAACGGVQHAFDPASAAEAALAWPAGTKAAVVFTPAPLIASEGPGPAKKKRRGPKKTAKKKATAKGKGRATPRADGLLDAAELLAAGFVRALDAEGALVSIQDAAARVSSPTALRVVADRVVLGEDQRSRLMEAFDTAFGFGGGRAALVALDGDRPPLDITTFPRCETCGVEEAADATPPTGLFSFNSPIGACETCRGFGRMLELDPAKIVPDPTRAIASDAIKPFGTPKRAGERSRLRAFCERRGISMYKAWKDLSAEDRRAVIDGDSGYRGVRGFFRKLERKSYRMHYRVLLARYRSQVPCTECGGTRLKPEALRWLIDGRSIADLHAMSVEDALAFAEAIPTDGPRAKVAKPIRDELVGRLRYLNDVGLGYLTLDRTSRTLSGGERARAALAASLGASLVDTLFVLDEPTTGLHARDTERLVRTLHGLRDAGNTVVVVEHDPDIIDAADHVVDLGPHAGSRGGEVVYEGPPATLRRPPAAVRARSRTAAFLGGAETLPARDRRPPPAADDARVVVRGARANNLAGVDLELPLRRLVVVSGVSGSGKSSLVHEVLVPGVSAAIRGSGRVRGRDVTAAVDDSDGAAAVERFDTLTVEPKKALADVVHVDQEPLTQTPRASVISYVGGQAALRDLFAATTDAQTRGLRGSDFSTNTGRGRCERCRGAGFERVEMQFLPDLRVRCPDCSGKRFRPEVLRVRWNGLSIDDVLSMTIEQAHERFGAPPAGRRPTAADRALGRLLRALQPLREIGLGYLEIGRSLDGLSAGEAQRLKLAQAVADASRRGRAGKLGGTLFVLDEPTNGLHLGDVSVLCSMLDRLLEDGHSLVVVEHHPDVIARADWVIDLGPEGGDAGGRIVVAGPPDAVAAARESRTGAVLRREATRAPRVATPPARRARRAALRDEAAAIREAARHAIVVRGAREHNLQQVDIDLPRGRFVVLSGPSGSGKSTLAYDILFSEGRRRYMETLSPYARRYLRPTERPDVEVVAGVPPTVAIEQRETRAGRKSTVATVTEIHAYLRVLFARRGERRCPDCDVAITAETRDALTERLAHDLAGKQTMLLAPLVRSRKGEHRELIGRLRDDGAPGVVVDGEVHRFDDPDAALPKLARYGVHDVDAIVWEGKVPTAFDASRKTLDRPIKLALDRGEGTLVVQGPRGGRRVFSTTLSCPKCGRGFDAPDPRELSFHSPRGWCEGCRGTGMRPHDEWDLAPEWGDEDGPLSDEDDSRGARHDDALLLGGGANGGADDDADEGDPAARAVLDIDGDGHVCPRCGGARLRPESLAIRVGGRSIAEICSLPIDRAADALEALQVDEVGARPVAEAVARLRVLERVGLRYLSLDRPFWTLSGGEAQRVKLAAQIGAGPCGVLYILDEPTIGLHARDTGRLVATLRELCDHGSSVVVVEHDEDVIRSADTLVDLGPGGGRRGGRVLSVGAPERVLAHGHSETSRLLGAGSQGRLALFGAMDRPEDAPAVVVRGAGARNLRGIDVTFPLGALTVVTGVSGSGKSTLVIDVLARALARVVNRRVPKEASHRAARSKVDLPPGLDGLHGAEAIRRVAVVDSSPIGRTPRSVPLTYIGAFDHLRKLFAMTREARALGFGPGRFSFNVKGGRCERCRGLGSVSVGMSFLPDARVLCEACGGARYEPQTLRVKWKGLSIADALHLTVEEAAAVFESVPKLHRALSFLEQIGLGYLQLGQPSTTLSGGEAQRIKLAAELAGGAERAARGQVFYVLDEPTTGLAVGDVGRLVGALRRLTERGDAVCVIEHNMEVIKAADCLVDLGPEGGPEGGRLTAWGPPARLLAEGRRSHTLDALARYLDGASAATKETA